MAFRGPPVARVVIENAFDVAVASRIFLFCRNIRHSTGNQKIANLRIPSATDLHFDVGENELARLTARQAAIGMGLVREHFQLQPRDTRQIHRDRKSIIVLTRIRPTGLYCPV